MQIHRGGSFAPPLPPEKLQEYRALCAVLPAHLRAATGDLCEMMDVYNPQPPSSLPGTPHPTGPAYTGQFKLDGTAIMRPAPLMVPLEEPVKEVIGPHVPWEHECEMMKGLFDPVQESASRENSRLTQAWSRSVISHIVLRHFPDGDFETIWASLVAMNKNPSIRQVMTDDMRERMEAYVPRVNECTRELTIALSTKRYEPIPRPRFEDTKLRDASHHLLWHAIELEKDREPMTSDKLLGV